MSKLKAASLMLTSVVVLAGCEDTTDGFGSVTGAPLNSAEIREQIAGNSIVGENYQGTPARIFFNDDLKAIFGDVPGGYSVQYELLKNGLICDDQGDRRFCYRVYRSGDNVSVRYADGAVEFSGELIEGNIFSS